MGQGASSGGGAPREGGYGDFGSAPGQDAQYATRIVRTPPLEAGDTVKTKGLSPLFVGSPGTPPQQNAVLQVGNGGRGSANDNGQGNHSTKKKLVPTVFRWGHGGHAVYVIGTFNNWKERIPMRSSHEEFVTIVDLEPGTTHQYKFIVDDMWRHNPDHPTVADRAGATNNTIDVGEAEGMDFEDFISPVWSSPPGSYSKEMPKLDASLAAPPTLPVHLLQILLNSEPVSESDPTLLPIPNHVMLHHLYALSISDSTMVLGVTTRYESKYITTILYRAVGD